MKYFWELYYAFSRHGLCNSTFCFHTGSISSVSLPQQSTPPPPGAEGGVSSTLIITGKEMPFHAAKNTLIALSHIWHCSVVTHYLKSIQCFQTCFFKVDLLWLLHFLVSEDSFGDIPGIFAKSCNQGNPALVCRKCAKPRQQKLPSEMLIDQKLISQPDLHLWNFFGCITWTSWVYQSMIEVTPRLACTASKWDVTKKFISGLSWLHQRDSSSGVHSMLPY